MSKKILLIGGGITSSLIAYNLKRLKVPLDIYIWEAQDTIGGRFSTTRFSKSFGDLGAQYLTHTNSRAWSKPFFDCLIENELLQSFSTTNISGFRSSLQEDKENYVCTKGTEAIVKYFIDKGNVKHVACNKKVIELRLKDYNGIEVIPDDQSGEHFDIVISTLPVPQLLQLRNVNEILNHLNQHVKTCLANVSYTSRYALGLFYNGKLKLKSGEQGMNYVDNDPIIRYWTVENEKRMMGMMDKTEKNLVEIPSAVVVHTTVSFGAEHGEENVEHVKELLMKRITDGRFKTLENVRPDYVTCQKWRYSQVDVGYINSPGFIELSNSSVILAAGDGFTFSGFEGCILSAEKTVEKLKSILEGENK